MTDDDSDIDEEQDTFMGLAHEVIIRQQTNN